MAEKQKENFKTNRIKRVSMVDQVCNSIKNEIACGMLTVGDKLPSEFELADMFGVNRLTVRMALQKLSTIGIVETRVGEGSFVQDFTLSKYLNEISDIYLSTANLEDICALRKAIELEATELTISKAAPEEMEELKGKLDRFLSAINALHTLEGGSRQELLNEIVERDLDFHYEICCCSHNILFKDLFKLLRPLIKRHLAYLFINRDRKWIEDGKPAMGMDLHEKLYQCILSKDRRACKEIYLDLIDFQPPYCDD